MKLSFLVPEFMWYAFKSILVQLRLKNIHNNQVSAWLTEVFALPWF